MSKAFNLLFSGFKHPKFFSPEVILLLMTFAVNFLIALKNKFFFADDWAWLLNAERYSAQDIFRILPTSIYNDRPIGALFINLEYELMHLNYYGYRLIHVVIHCLNTYLLFLIIRKLTTPKVAFIGAMYFGLFYPANLAAFWIAAVFDLLSLTFILSAILVMLFAKPRPSYRQILVIALFYFLALRTKEYAISLPFLLLMMHKLKYGNKAFELVKIYWPILVISSIYLSKYYQLFLESKSKSYDQDPYGLGVSDAIANIIYYFNQATGAFKLSGWQMGLYYLVLSFLTIHIFNSRRENAKLLVIGATGFLITLGPVILLSNQKSDLYLYAPHAFLSFCASAFFVFKRRILNSTLLIFALIFVVFLVLPAREVLNFNYQKSAYSLNVWENSLDSLRGLEPNTKVFIAGLEPYFNPFSYGPGASIKILNQDDSITSYIDYNEMDIVQQYCESAEPKLLLFFVEEHPIANQVERCK